MTEFDVTKKAIKMLEKEYGFDIDQIKQEVKFVKLNNQEAIVDIVVYGKEKGKITKDVVLVVEVKSGPLLSPLYEHQLKITMSYTNAQYGMVFNGEEKSCLSQEIDADVKSLHKKNVSDFGEFSLIADIPTKKKIKNKPKQEANLDNFARAKIAEIRHFLDRVLETKSSHNFLIYFMIQAKIGLKLNNFGAMPSKKWEKLHALIRTFPERYEKIDRKKIENKDDLSKLSKKELVVLASELQSKATRLTKNELVERWAGIILAGEDEEKFIKNQLELIEKKDVKHLLHFIGLFEVEELEFLAMEKYFRELPLPDAQERDAVIWRSLVSLLRTGNPKKDRMLIPYFEPMFEYCFDNVLDDLGLKMDVSGQRPEDAYYPITIGNSSLINERDFELDGEINYKGISYFAFNDHRFVDPLIFDNKQRPYRTYKKDGSLSEWKDGQDYEKWNSIISIPQFGKKIDQSLKKDLKKYGINESQGIYYFILHMINTFSLRKSSKNFENLFNY